MATTVYERIREAIVAGELEPGIDLSENALAKEFGTSRTPVREALHRLEIELLVERAGRSVRVRSTSPEEILDIYHVRITLEGAAARDAAERATQLDRARLRVAADSMRQCPPDARERARRNRVFHEAVWAASHSPTLIDLLHRLNVHLVRYPRTTLESNDRWEAVLTEHEDLLTAISERDPDRAAMIAESHMAAAREVRLQMMAEGN